MRRFVGDPSRMNPSPDLYLDVEDHHPELEINHIGLIRVGSVSCSFVREHIEQPRSKRNANNMCSPNLFPELRHCSPIDFLDVI